MTIFEKVEQGSPLPMLCKSAGKTFAPFSRDALKKGAGALSNHGAQLLHAYIRSQEGNKVLQMGMIEVPGSCILRDHKLIFLAPLLAG